MNILGVYLVEPFSIRQVGGACLAGVFQRWKADSPHCDPKEAGLKEGFLFTMVPMGPPVTEALDACPAFPCVAQNPVQPAPYFRV
jgi:hypothetical protein